MQRDTEYNLHPDRQPGDLAVARQTVATMQSEALYVSFLLTGDRQAAIALAETAFLELFSQTASTDVDIDRRTQLLLLIGKVLLRGDYKERIERNLPAGLLADPAPARFGVDNRRTLLLAALGRLNDRERVALILNDLSGLDSTTLNTLLERRNEPLVAPVETARQRVRQSVDIPQGEPLRPALVEATFDAPRINLWPRLEEPMAEIQRRQRKKSQIITYGIVGVVAVVLLAGIAFLFGGSILDGGDAAESGSGSLAGQELTAPPSNPTPELSPPVFAPTATPRSALPEANVPGWFLTETMHGPEGNLGSYRRTLERYSPQQNEFQNLFVNEIQMAEAAFPVQFSPDGHQMTLFREERVDLESTYYIDSFATQNDGRQWETELLSMNRDPNTNPDFNLVPRLAAAHTDDRVYVAVMTTGTEPRLTLHELSQHNGKSRGMVEIELPLRTVNLREFRGNIYLFAPENSESLHLAIESYDDGLVTWRGHVYTIDRAELSVSDPYVLTSEDDQRFLFWEARPTTDGRSLYGLQIALDGSSSEVRFLELQTGDLKTIELPFPLAPNYQYSSITAVVSHDGQRMYVLDPLGTSVAIINLSEQRLKRHFPLESGEFASRIGESPDQYHFGYSAILSADGSEIYINAIKQDPFRDDTPWEAGIWIIDAATWRVTGLAPVEGFVDTLHLAPENGIIRVLVRVAVDEGQAIEMVTLSMKGLPGVIDRVRLPSSEPNSYWLRSPADLYQLQFNRSPAIDGLQPTDGQTISTLPRLDVSTGPETVTPGGQAAIEVRVLDPSSGELLTEDRQDVRFESLAGVTAIVDSPDGERQFLILGQAEPGVYRGSVAVHTAGSWTVDVAVSVGEGQSWVSPRAGQIHVAPTYVGSDGRAYLFQLSLDPEQPIKDRHTTVLLRLVDAETGEPLPETTTLSIAGDARDNDTPSDLPERVEVRFSKGRQGVQTATLDKTANGVYEGRTFFWLPGPQVASILLQPRGHTQMTIPVRSIVVVVE